MNNTIAKGGQSGAIAWKDKEVVKLFELFCLRHTIHDAEHSTINYRAHKMALVKMEQVIVEEDTKEGRKYEYWKKCPKCFQLIKEGEYIKEE